MTQNEHEQNLVLARQIKQTSDDMHKIVVELNKLPKGQLKKVLTDEIKEIFKKYGVEF